VQFAQTAALTQLVANEQILTFKAAADRLKIRIHSQRRQLGQRLPATADLISKSIHKRVDAQGS
jgi:DNA-binding GntR family transcriptional regulator